jgi:putative ABC transport system permease protein
MWDTTLRDLLHAARSLRRSTSFTVVAVATLAIGIGATTAVFSVVDGVLLKPLPYPQSDRLVALWHDAPGAPGLAAVGGGGLQMSVSMLVTYREQNRSFDNVGLWGMGVGNVTGRGEPEQIDRALVTGQTLAVFGVPPLLGRWIQERDEEQNSPAVALLSYGYWQDRFGADPNVLGQRIEIDSVLTEIVGVMPRGFRFGDAEADVIGAIRFNRATLIPPPFNFNGIARLKPGVTIAQANADIERMLPIWLEMFPFQGGQSGARIYRDTWRMGPALETLKADVIGTVGNSLWVVLAMIGIVLVIASANVTNLLLVRGESRARELEVRAALGAGTWRIARSMLAESLLLAVVAGGFGVALAYGAVKALLALTPQQLPRLAEIALDARSLTFALLVTLAAGAAISLAPVLRAARARLSTSLRAARGTSASRAQHRAQNSLVVGQIALALVLLVSSGLMIRTFEALRSVEPGFAVPGSLQTFRIIAPNQSDPRAILVEQRAIVRALEAIPGVTSVGFTSALPMDEVAPSWNGISVEGGNVELEAALRAYNYLSPGYLETMGIPVIAGRGLTWADLEETRLVTLVSAGLARELFGSPDAALGRRIRGTQGGALREIVGVVDDVRSNGLESGPPATVYWPSMMADFFINVPLFVQRGVAFSVRSPLAGTPGLARQVEQAVWSVNPDLPLASVRTMQDLYDRSLARTSFTLVMLVAAAGAALVLGIVGLYGVLSYVVSTRRREIAIRFALGARASDVQARVVRQGVALAGIGVAIGLIAAAGVTRLMTSLLYEVHAVDPLTYAAVAAGLIGVAALASYLPARRASAVDPAESLAAE